MGRFFAQAYPHLILLGSLCGGNGYSCNKAEGENEQELDIRQVLKLTKEIAFVVVDILHHVRSEPHFYWFCTFSKPIDLLLVICRHLFLFPLLLQSLGEVHVSGKHIAAVLIGHKHGYAGIALNDATYEIDILTGFGKYKLTRCFCPDIHALVLLLREAVGEEVGVHDRACHGGKGYDKYEDFFHRLYGLINVVRAL